MKVYLYGLGDASVMYRVLYYRYLEDREISFRGMDAEAEFMMAVNPSIKEVYAIFDRRGFTGTTWRRQRRTRLRVGRFSNPYLNTRVEE